MVLVGASRGQSAGGRLGGIPLREDCQADNHNHNHRLWLGARPNQCILSSAWGMPHADCIRASDMSIAAKFVRHVKNLFCSEFHLQIYGSYAMILLCLSSGLR
jgi:hypothetical protein